MSSVVSVNKYWFPQVLCFLCIIFLPCNSFEVILTNVGLLPIWYDILSVWYSNCAWSIPKKVHVYS